MGGQLPIATMGIILAVPRNGMRQMHAPFMWVKEDTAAKPNQ
jgi:hypothetical protein